MSLGRWSYLPIVQGQQWGGPPPGEGFCRGGKEGQRPIFNACRTVEIFGLFFLDALPIAAQAALLELRLSFFRAAIFFFFDFQLFLIE